MAIDHEVCLKHEFRGVYSFMPSWEEFYEIAYNDASRIWVMSLNNETIHTFHRLRDARIWLYKKYVEKI